MVNWKSVEEFNNDFLKPLFKKSSKYLEKDGHLVLYIEDRDIEGFIEWMKLFVQTDLPELEYEGAFYYQGTSLRPYYVWLKK
jgi:hypothetical protein